MVTGPRLMGTCVCVNGVYVYSSPACVKTEKWPSNVDEMTENGKEEGKDRWKGLTVDVLGRGREHGLQINACLSITKDLLL